MNNKIFTKFDKISKTEHFHVDQIYSLIMIVFWVFLGLPGKMSVLIVHIWVKGYKLFFKHKLRPLINLIGRIYADLKFDQSDI